MPRYAGGISCPSARTASESKDWNPCGKELRPILTEEHAGTVMSEQYLQDLPIRSFS
jgi:hypothetical protein